MVGQDRTIHPKWALFSKISQQMKRMSKTILAIGLMAGTSYTGAAQYYEIANQIPSLIKPALIGGLNYKGFVEASYLKGIGSHNVDFLQFSTSQGFRYSNWFYMGVGIGVDVLFSHRDENFGSWEGAPPDYDGHSAVTSAAMIPLFTDFRFNIGSSQNTSFFIDLKIGCSFLASDSWVEVDNGYLTNQEYFLLRPAIGVRIPTGKSGKQAVDVGLKYQLLTSNYWSSCNYNVTLNSLGLSVAYEW